MPEICRFFGIIIRMNFNDHVPAHFHADYAGRVASVGISPPRVIEGRVPPSVARRVLAWASLHEMELLANWERARRGVPPERIPPLE